MNRRFVGNLLIATFIILAISGLLMFLKPFNKSVASIHTLFGFIIIISVLIHLINNKKPVARYLTGKGVKSIAKFQGLFLVLAVILLGASIYLNLPGANLLYDWGNERRDTEIGKSEEILDYQIIDLSQNTGAYKFSVEVKKGRSFGHPLFAIWLADSADNYIQTLYISNAISSSVFQKAVYVEKHWNAGIARRPEALPVWSHRRGILASDGLYVPLDKASDLDGVSGATPTSNFIVNSNLGLESLPKFKVFLEVNQSFDWNEYYSKDAFPDDPIYSGPGFVGQPALVYSVEISKEQLEKNKYFLMKLEGHSHHSGMNGNIYTNVDSLTTALNIVDRIIVSVEKK